MSRRKNKLVPFETIVLATQGDPQALEQVIRHYRDRRKAPGFIYGNIRQ